MKKILSILIVMILTLSMVTAQEEITVEGVLDTGSITPDSPFYFMERVWDNIRMNNPLIGEQKREQIRLEVYSERKDEAQYMYMIGKSEKAEVALNCIKDEVAKEQAMEQIKNTFQYQCSGECEEPLKAIVQTQSKQGEK